MSLEHFLSSPAEACKRRGPNDLIVLSSRVRLARNLREFAFPGWAKKNERIKSWEIMKEAVQALPMMEGGFSASLEDVTPARKTDSCRKTSHQPRTCR